MMKLGRGQVSWACAKLVETGGEAYTAPEMSEESHMFVAKLAAATESVPSCLDTCSGTTRLVSIGEAFGKRATSALPGQRCASSSSTTSWEEGLR